MYDMSCIPYIAQGAFTTYISKLWEAAAPDVTAQDLIMMSGMLANPYALGQHYFVPDPNNASSGQLFAKWDFTSSPAFRDDPNVKNAYLVALRTGEVSSPDDATRDHCGVRGW